MSFIAVAEPVPHFFDTNILIYSIGRDPSEAGKRSRAIELLEREDGALSVQVLQEFYVQATRPTRRDPVPHEFALALVKAWTRFAVQETTLAIMMRALEIKAEHRFSYWDSAIVAAAEALGCRTLYSEDMAHDRRIGGVRIVNPFAA